MAVTCPTGRAGETPVMATVCGVPAGTSTKPIFKVAVCAAGADAVVGVKFKTTLQLAPAASCGPQDELEAIE